MTVTHAWSITNLDYMPRNGLPKVVCCIHYEVISTDSESNVSVRGIGTFQVGEPSPEDFTPWEDLTEAAVLSWIAAPAKAAIEEAALSRIAAKLAEISETVGAGTPW